MNQFNIYELLCVDSNGSPGNTCHGPSLTQWTDNGMLIYLLHARLCHMNHAYTEQNDEDRRLQVQYALSLQPRLLLMLWLNPHFNPNPSEHRIAVCCNGHKPTSTRLPCGIIPYSGEDCFLEMIQHPQMPSSHNRRLLICPGCDTTLKTLRLFAVHAYFCMFLPNTARAKRIQNPNILACLLGCTQSFTREELFHHDQLPHFMCFCGRIDTTNPVHDQCPTKPIDMIKFLTDDSKQSNPEAILTVITRRLAKTDIDQLLKNPDETRDHLMNILSRMTTITEFRSAPPSSNATHSTHTPTNPYQLARDTDLRMGAAFTPDATTHPWHQGIYPANNTSTPSGSPGSLGLATSQMAPTINAGTIAMGHARHGWSQTYPILPHRANIPTMQNNMDTVHYGVGDMHQRWCDDPITPYLQNDQPLPTCSLSDNTIPSTISTSQDDQSKRTRTTN